MKRRNKLTLVISWFLIMLILNYTVPYTILKDLKLLRGTFLFWIVLSLIAIGSMFLLMSRWRLQNE